MWASISRSIGPWGSRNHTRRTAGSSGFQVTDYKNRQAALTILECRKKSSREQLEYPIEKEFSMGEWNRTTSKMALNEIRPEHWNAIQKHIEAYDLQPDLSDYLICIETISRQKKKKLFRGGIPNQTIQIAIITPKWLIIGVQGDKPDSTGVLSIQLKDAIAKDYKDEPGYKLIQDTGVNVTGIYTGRVGMHGSSHIMSFIGLGQEPVAEEFKEILFKTIANAKM